MNIKYIMFVFFSLLIIPSLLFADDPRYEILLDANGIPTQYEITPEKSEHIDSTTNNSSESYTETDKKVFNLIEIALEEMHDELPEGMRTDALKEIVAEMFIGMPEESFSYMSEDQFMDMIKEMVKSLPKDILKDEAISHLEKGRNYEKLRKYDNAEDEFKKALGLYPEYALAYEHLGYIYASTGRFSQDRLNKAIELYKKAIAIKPDSHYSYYGIGSAYLRMEQYEESINWLLKAVSYKPDNKGYITNLADAYRYNEDIENAAIFYIRYLELEPNEALRQPYENLLRSLKVDYKESPRDPINDLQNLLQKKQFTLLEQRLTAIQNDQKIDDDGYRQLTYAYGMLCDKPSGGSFGYTYEIWLKNYEDWLTHSPLSHFANICIGKYYVNFAWDARGKWWGNTVTDKGRELFNKHLLTAQEYLEKAYELDKSDPFAPKFLITVAMGLALNYEEMEKQFQRAIKADSSDYSIYEAKLYYLKPQWHGSKGQMFSFARETFKTAPSDSMAPLVLGNAHWEMVQGTSEEEKKAYFSNPVVWKELKELYTELCERFPYSNVRHNWFARTAYLAGDFEAAKKELDIIQDDWIKGAWNDYESFNKAREEVNSYRKKAISE